MLLLHLLSFIKFKTFFDEYGMKVGTLVVSAFDNYVNLKMKVVRGQIFNGIGGGSGGQGSPLLGLGYQLGLYTTS